MSDDDFKLYVCAVRVRVRRSQRLAGGRHRAGHPLGRHPRRLSCPDCGAAKSDFEMVEIAPLKCPPLKFWDPANSENP